MSRDAAVELAEALRDVLRVFDAPFSTSPEQRRRIRGRAERALARTLVPAASETGLPPGMRLVPGPVGTCDWGSHHWIKDRWDQTICAACNTKIEPIPAASEPSLDGLPTADELAQALTECAPARPGIHAEAEAILHELRKNRLAIPLASPETT